MKIVVAIYSEFRSWCIPEVEVERLRAEFPEHTFVRADNDAETLAAILSADAAFSSRITAEHLASAFRLQWIHSPAAGVGAMLFPQMVASTVVMTNSRGNSSRTIAEHVMAVTLALLRSLPLAFRRQAERAWAQNEFNEPGHVRTLRDAKVLIVGLGSIGSETARLASAFGAAVTGVRRRPELGLEGPGSDLFFLSPERIEKRDPTPSPAPVQVTRTPESEYSPTVTPSGALSVIRVELDGNNTQRLWQFTLDGKDPRLVLEQIKPVGYHAWADDKTLALFVLGQPATLQLADTTTGAARVVASDIGRSIQVIPGSASPREISFVHRERSGEAVRLLIKKLNPRTGEISLLTPAVEGGNEADTAWTPDGTLLMVRGNILYGWRAGQTGWKEITSLERLSLRGVTRLAVSPKGDFLALVGSPR